MKTQSSSGGFTLVELLVVIGIVAVLAALLLPAIESVRDEGKKAACLSNLRNIGAGIALYAADHSACIPYGPKAGPFTSPADFYPSTGAPTSLISLRSGEPVGLGLTLKYLKDPHILFCPGAEQRMDADTELSRVGNTQAQSGYYYRHAGNTQLFDSPNLPEPHNLMLGNLGDNRNGRPVRALVIDTIFLCPDDLGDFNVKPRSNHREKFANILFSDGHAASRANGDARFTVDIRTGSLRAAFDKILKVFETADQEP